MKTNPLLVICYCGRISAARVLAKSPHRRYGRHPVSRSMRGFPREIRAKIGVGQLFCFPIVWLGCHSVLEAAASGRFCVYKQKRQPAAPHTSATSCRIAGIRFNPLTNDLLQGQGSSTASSSVAPTQGPMPWQRNRHNLIYDNTGLCFCQRRRPQNAVIPPPYPVHTLTPSASPACRRPANGGAGALVQFGRTSLTR